MATDIKEIFKFLFPEYQIGVCAKECGFIAKAVPERVCPADRVVSPDKQADRTVQGVYMPAKEDARSMARANDAFEDLADALKKYWPGSEKDRITICRAYQRPYIRGFDNIKPRNAILLAGSGSGMYAIRGISELLRQKRVFRYAEVAVMNFESYVSDTTDALFLRDLYGAFIANTETVLFENVDRASKAQLDMLYQLLSEGSCQLSKQSTAASDSRLVGAAGGWNAQAVTSIVTNGKFLVFTTTMPQAKIMSFLGNRFVRELGDIIALDPTVQDSREV